MITTQIVDHSNIAAAISLIAAGAMITSFIISLIVFSIRGNNEFEKSGFIAVAIFAIIAFTAGFTANFMKPTTEDVLDRLGVLDVTSEFSLPEDSEVVALADVVVRMEDGAVETYDFATLSREGDTFTLTQQDR